MGGAGVPKGLPRLQLLGPLGITEQGAIGKLLSLAGSATRIFVRNPDLQEMSPRFYPEVIYSTRTAGMRY